MCYDYSTFVLYCKAYFAFLRPVSNALYKIWQVSNIKIVGKVSQQIANLLGLTLPVDTAIYLGDTNLQHMQTSHPEDFSKYGGELLSILAAPDYVGINPKDGSIEYVKEFYVDEEFVKVAVRLAGSGRYYARSLYILNERRVHNYIAKGTLKKT